MPSSIINTDTGKCIGKPYNERSPHTGGASWKLSSKKERRGMCLLIWSHFCLCFSDGEWRITTCPPHIQPKDPARPSWPACCHQRSTPIIPGCPQTFWGGGGRERCIMFLKSVVNVSKVKISHRNPWTALRNMWRSSCACSCWRRGQSWGHQAEPTGCMPVCQHCLPRPAEFKFPPWNSPRKLPDFCSYQSFSRKEGSPASSLSLSWKPLSLSDRPLSIGFPVKATLPKLEPEVEWNRLPVLVYFCSSVHNGGLSIAHKLTSTVPPQGFEGQSLSPPAGPDAWRGHHLMAIRCQSGFSRRAEGGVGQNYLLVSG